MLARSHRALLTPSFLAFALCGAAAADTLTVPGQFPSLRHALNAANDGDEIVVADGVYTGGQNKNLDFHGKRVVLRSQNGAESCVIDCEGVGRAFRFHQGETPESVLDGFTIRNGSMPHGGGILCVGSSPTVRNCILADNTAHPGQYNGGAGMSNQHGSSPVITGCLFVRNRQVQHSTRANGGGGMNNGYGSSPIVSQCAFVDNFAQQGAGMLSADDCHPVVTDCQFVSNHAEIYGGGMLTAIDSSVEVRRCSFVWNSSGRESAGFGLYRQSSAVLIDCRFDRNWADEMGGGVVSLESECLVLNCEFTGNSASAWDWWGGGGGMVNSRGRATLYNCLFSGNNGGNGEAGAFGGGHPGTVSTLVNCTLVGNWSNGGGAMCVVNGAQVHLQNCILWDNVAASFGNQIAMIQIGLTFAPTTTALDNCVVQAGQAGIWLENPAYQVQWGATNVVAEPQFTAPHLGDFTLAAGSPCIDSGDVSALPPDAFDLDGDGDTSEPLPLDLAGAPRVQGRTGRVDMGAFERAP